MLAKHSSQSALVAFVIILFVTCANAHYDENAVCLLAHEQNAFIDPPQNVTCGQGYLDGLPPAPNAYVPYPFCAAHFGGIDLAHFGEPSRWLAPIVQFILPSFIFSMNIPRGQMLLPAHIVRTVEAQAALRHNLWQTLIVSFWHLVLFLLVTIDSLLWVFLILAMAGPMMVSALHEAVLDHKIVRALYNPSHLTLNELDEPRRNGVTGEVGTNASNTPWNNIPLLTSPEHLRAAEQSRR
jgi:hypothetical protein